MSDNEDLLSYEIGDIDVHDDGDDLDAVEDELLMSDDEHNLDDGDRIPVKHSKIEVSGSTSKNDKQIVSPPVDTECSNKAVTEKVPKKRTLKRNVSSIVNTAAQPPSKQVKHVTDEQSSQNAKQESQPDDGPAKESTVEEETPQNATYTVVAKVMAEPVTPTKSNQNLETCSLSELDSPVASLIFSQSGDNATPTTATTSQDESCSCVDDSESESSSVQNSQEESAVISDFDSKVDTELEDSDDCTERMNARLCVERDISQDSQINQVRPQFYKNQRGGLSPRSNVGGRPPQNFPPQFNTFAQRPNNLQFHPRYGPPPMMAPPQNPQSGQRMDFRGIVPLNFSQHGHAVNRPNFPQNGPTFPPYNQQNPMGHFEPNGPMMYPSRPPLPPFNCPTAPFAGPPRHETTAQPHIVPLKKMEKGTRLQLVCILVADIIFCYSITYLDAV